MRKGRTKIQLSHNDQRDLAMRRVFWFAEVEIQIADCGYGGLRFTHAGEIAVSQSSTEGRFA